MMITSEEESGTVVTTIPPGITRNRSVVSVNGDILFEPDEYVVVSFHNPTNAVMGGFYGLGVGIIQNDDAVPKVVPGVAAINESDVGSQALVDSGLPVRPVVRDRDRRMDHMSSFRVLRATKRNRLGTTRLRAARSRSLRDRPTQSVVVSVHGDTGLEPDEYVVISFRNPTNALIGGFWGLGIGIIQNDD